MNKLPNILPANRINTVKEYYFSKKLSQIEAMKASGALIINLGIGNPDLTPSEDTITELISSVKDKCNHGYQSYNGIAALRNAFAEWYKSFYGIDLDFNREILPLLGSKEGITHISLAFLNPNDEVLVPNPGYPAYKSVSELCEVKVRYYSLKEDNNWYPNFKDIERNDLSNVKLMWINYPNMPTGKKASIEVFEEIIDFGIRHNILICNDNPYSFISNDEPMSIFSIPRAKDIAIELNSLSKSHNMAGWRVGMVAAKAEFINHILKVKSNVDSGMFKPIQLAAAKGLSNTKAWYKEQNVIYAQRRSIVWKILDALSCTYDLDQTGMFVWAKIPDNCNDAEVFSDEILNDLHVFVTPGSIFGSNGDRFIRVSLCNNEDVLNETLNRINKL